MARLLPDWIKAYMDYASITEAPEYCHFWTGVFTVAGALRRRVWYDQLHFQWTPNFYLVFVAPSGIISKSTTLDIGTKLLRQVKGVRFGPDVVTWQSLTEKLEEAHEGVLMPHDNLIHEMSCLTIASSEFGTLVNPADRDMIETLTAMWDSRLGLWEKTTKTSGSNKVVNPWLNIAGCTTPAWVRDSFTDFHLLGGFASRMVWVYGDEKSKLVAYLDDVIQPVEFKAKEKVLVHDLIKIAELRGPFTLTPEAKDWGRSWYSNHWNNPPKHLDREKFGGYISRKQGHVHKLAMVLTASRSDLLVIEKDILEASAKITDMIELEMNKVFDVVSQDRESRDVMELLAIVRMKGKITQKELFQLLYKKMGYDAFQKAIVSAVEAGVITVIVEANRPFIVPTQRRGNGKDGLTDSTS